MVLYRESSYNLNHKNCVKLTHFNSKFTIHFIIEVNTQQGAGDSKNKVNKVRKSVFCLNGNEQTSTSLSLSSVKLKWLEIRSQQQQCFLFLCTHFLPAVFNMEHYVYNVPKLSEMFTAETFVCREERGQRDGLHVGLAVKSNANHTHSLKYP